MGRPLAQRTMSYIDNSHHPEVLTDGRRWTPAPIPTDFLGMTSGAITGVYLAADEEVEWQTMHASDGSVKVTGYTIKKRKST